MNLSDFFHMDGYAAYVWSSYGLTLAVLIAIHHGGRRYLKSAQAQARRRAEITEHRP